MCMSIYHFAELQMNYFISEEDKLAEDGKSLQVLREGPEEISHKRFVEIRMKEDSQ